jgi:hypothetical protein
VTRLVLGRESAPFKLVPGVSRWFSFAVVRRGRYAMATAGKVPTVMTLHVAGPPSRPIARDIYGRGAGENARIDGTLPKGDYLIEIAGPKAGYVRTRVVRT